MIDVSLEQDENAIISSHQGVLSSLTLNLISVVFTSIGSDVQLSAFEAQVTVGSQSRYFIFFYLSFSISKMRSLYSLTHNSTRKCSLKEHSKKLVCAIVLTLCRLCDFSTKTTTDSLCTSDRI